jgi:dTDP-4-amino-4,6-dideoxy-D-galactose acyltransferase
MIRFKQWDSEFFGYPVGILSYSDELTPSFLHRLITTSSYRLVYAFVAPGDSVANATLQKAGGFWSDTKIVYTKKSTLTDLPENPFIRRLDAKQEENYAALLALALASGIHSRFKTDPHFTNNEFQRLYQAWLDRSLEGSMADHVWIYQQEGEVAGFVTDIRKENIVEIGLIAVNSTFRGLGIGSSLLAHVEALAKAKAASAVEVATQRANGGACRFYEQNGYRVKEEINIYHFWNPA